MTARRTSSTSAATSISTFTKMADWLDAPIDMLRFLEMKERLGERWAGGRLVGCYQTKTRYHVTWRSADDSTEATFYGSVEKARKWMRDNDPVTR